MSIKFRAGLIICTLFLAACNANEDFANYSRLTIAVAANMQIAMEEIAAEFERQHQIEVEIASSSSGVLTAQIEHGAPFHLFVSANMRYPDVLEEKGLTIGSTRHYANGALVLWSIDGTPLDEGLNSLQHESVEKFVIANPEIAPYGIAAMQALQSSGLFDKLQDKMVMGESIGQVNQYVSSGAVQVGLTSRSVLYSKNLRSKGESKVIGHEYYEPIKQGIVILKQDSESSLQASQLFFDFMISDGVKTILADHGYDPI